MEIEKNTILTDDPTPQVATPSGTSSEALNDFFPGNLGSPVMGDDVLKAKSSLRIHYEAQIAVMERQLGGLESVRQQLGLSQRKMAQLLLVDPSAWTRWNRPGNRAPGIVWRALQWFMILQEKVPGLTSQYFLGSSPAAVQAEAMKEIRKESEAREVLEQKLTEMDRNLVNFQLENRVLQQKVNELEKVLKIWRVGTIIMTLTVIFSVFIWILWARRGFF